jgi:predicted nucleotidyltransferase
MLYGSRADDSKKGGDIDLLILTEGSHDRSIQYKIMASLYKALGERKIDLLIENPKQMGDFANMVYSGAIPL